MKINRDGIKNHEKIRIQPFTEEVDAQIKMLKRKIDCLLILISIDGTAIALLALAIWRLKQ
ncbi:hypothetical protein [[Clostridium] symbiosum]|uniref:hypothetical protein n=1 Tax=Clostridium symbiosum TaxID=1512 RepID=UPI0034A4B2D1